VIELDPASLATERSFKPCDVPTQLVPSPDGATLYIACESGSLVVYDAATETLESSVAGADGFGAAMTPDATPLWVTQPGAGTVAIVDLATNAVRHVSVCNSPRRIAFAMDGSAPPRSPVNRAA
jgi:DNA-binding beta-propeller fold protein YncE